MLSSRIKNRITKAQANARAGEPLARIAHLLSLGAFYDECTDEDKNAYCAYIGTEREALETVRGYLLGTLHFKLERKPKPPTPDEHRANVREVEAFFDEKRKEYNSPEVKAKREAEYQELQRIGAQRAAAFQAGKPWDAYPLPWERKRAEV